MNKNQPYLKKVFGFFFLFILQSITVIRSYNKYGFDLNTVLIIIPALIMLILSVLYLKEYLLYRKNTGNENELN